MEMHRDSTLYFVNSTAPGRAQLKISNTPRFCQTAQCFMIDLRWKAKKSEV